MFCGSGFLVVAFLLICLFAVTSHCKCFCHLTGQVDDCFCDIQTLENFNNHEIYPHLQKLIKQDFFRYYKVNLFKPCKFFDGDRGFCENEACSVKPCPEEDLPIGMRSGNSNVNLVGAESLKDNCDSHVKSVADANGAVNVKSISDVNGTLSNVTKNFLNSWDKHDDMLNPFCEIEDETSTELQYVDLLNNPERYTGFKGPLAWRIWRAIYEENCFLPDDRSLRRFTSLGEKPEGGGSLPFSNNELQGLCLEKRVFFRVISGLHSSINLHVCAQYLFEDGWGVQRWGPHLDEFVRRFDPSSTNGQGTARLKNLYFIYLLELRALSKVATYFSKVNVLLFTGRSANDIATKEMLMQLLNTTQKFPMHFDEDLMFKDANAKSLRREFTQRFLNVTRIIDCVTCEKCRLWGKLQTQGLGTALKILFSGKELANGSDPPFRLLRQEVVSLVNAFAKLSQSIKSLDVFRSMLTHESDQLTKDEL